MCLDATQLRQMVIKLALEKLGLWSTAAEELILIYPDLKLILGITEAIAELPVEFRNLTGGWKSTVRK